MNKRPVSYLQTDKRWKDKPYRVPGEDEFNCSYEYLMGETAHKTPEYYNMGKDPVLSLLDDSFFKSLKELLKDEGHQEDNLFMLQLFMSDPMQLQDFMETAFHYLYEIYTLNKMNDIGRAGRETMTAPLWASLRERFEALMPKLEHGFRKYEQRKADERAAFEEAVTTDDGASNTAVQPTGLDSRE